MLQLFVPIGKPRAQRAAAGTENQETSGATNCTKATNRTVRGKKEKRNAKTTHVQVGAHALRGVEIIAGARATVAK
jgi:hypothetical protein